MRTLRRRRFRPACTCGCWRMAHRHLLHAQALSHRSRQDRAHAPNHDAASAARAALVGSTGALGRTRCTPHHARVSIFPATSYKVTLPCKPIHRPCTRVGSHGQNGKPRCSTFLGSLRTWRPVAGFGAYGPMGGSTLAAMTTSLRTSLRNQMLEVHFDATQGCLLGQPAGSESILTFAQKAADETRADGRTGPPAHPSCISTGPPLYSGGLAPA
jgi:hypothetical protein